MVVISDSYAYLTLRMTMIAGANKYQLEDELVLADDFITFMASAFALQKKCYLKPLVDRM